MTIDFHGAGGRGFSWQWGKERDTPTRTGVRRPAPVDQTGGLTANEEMLKGAYHGTWQGLQFASPLMFTPVNVPVNMMGLPTPVSDNARTQRVLDEITQMMSGKMSKLHRGYLLSGTTWRFPRYDAKLDTLVWETISDSSVSDILMDVLTDKAQAMLTDEGITLSVGENQMINVRRKRRYEPGRVVATWEGQLPVGVSNYTAKNMAGVLPIGFAHDTDDNELRGYSVFSRIIRDLKDYHDIDYRISETLTKFRPKQVQTVTDLGKWCTNNLGTSDPTGLESYDVASNDLILNVKDEETGFEFLAEGATKSGETALQRKYWKIFEGSGLPEMFWGGLATGNHATAETQMQEAVSYVENLRREITPAYYDLYAASLRVLSIARMESYKPFKMKWNELESTSVDVKSQIFQRFSVGVAQLINSGGMTEQMLYNLWEMNFPEAQPGTIEEFIKGRKDIKPVQKVVKVPGVGAGADGAASVPADPSRESGAGVQVKTPIPGAKAADPAKK